MSLLAPLPAGSSSARPVTLKAIAARVGYSKNTVSLALRGDRQIPGHTRDRIRDVAHQMGYRNNALLSGVMSQLGAGRPCTFRAKLALLSADHPWHTLQATPALARLVEGCRTRASGLGYSFDPFWLLDPEFTADRWLQIMHARGIVGAVLVGLRTPGPLPPAMRALPAHFPTVIAGIAAPATGLAFSSVDHFHLAFAAVERARELGYARPGLVLDRPTDDAVDRRLSAGFSAAQDPLARPIPACLLEETPARETARVQRWFEEHQPDVVLLRDHAVADCLASHRLARVHDVGVLHLDVSPADRRFAGMDTRGEAVGEAAVDLLLEQIRRRERGISAGAPGTLLAAQWRDGASLRPPAVAANGVAAAELTFPQ